MLSIIMSEIIARHDVEIYNEATGWIVTSQSLAGCDLSNAYSGTPAWSLAVQDGIFVPIELVQDDPILVRIVVDQELTPQEAEEWVGHFTSRLRVPDGVLTISGGTEYLEGDEMEDYTQHIAISPGKYQVDVYTYLPWLNGEYCYKSASSEPLGTYFRRTRPNDTFPTWLQSECFEDPSIDPGHEEQWPEDNDTEDDADDEPAYVMFLVHLHSVENWEEIPSVPLDENGWVTIDAGARQPARCPLGLRFNVD
jgi:hypothetical protein